MSPRAPLYALIIDPPESSETMYVLNWDVETLRASAADYRAEGLDVSGPYLMQPIAIPVDSEVQA